MRRMLQLSFAQDSLLYGESIFWILSSIIAPLCWIPDLEKTQHRSAVQDLPHSTQLIRLYKRLARTWFVRSVWPKVITITHSIYLLIYVVLGIALQGRILESFNIHEADTLTYKTFYYSPTLFRIGLFINSVSALTHMRDSRWTTYDQAHFFAVDETFQVRVAFLCILAVLPDCVFNISDTFLIVSLIRSSDLPQHIRPSRAAWLSIYWLLLIVGLANSMFLYKPIVNLMFLSACIRRHFKCINEQIDSVGATSTTKGTIYRRNFNHASPSTGPSHSALVRRPQGVKRAYPERNSIYDVKNYLSTSNLSPLFEMISESAMPSKAPLQGQHHDPKHESRQPTEIRNLHQFERHLTQMHAFVSKSDTDSPAIVLSWTYANVMGFFYIILYVLCVGDAWGRIPALFNLIARLVPMVGLFFLGYTLESECDQLLNKIEVIYLQEHSHSLIYKQMLDTQHSLARVFKLLESIKFDCSGLMEVNFKTLKRCAVYVIGGIFLVLQYDLLVSS